MPELFRDYKKVHGLVAWELLYSILIDFCIGYT
jgi:hypothetical protein